MGIDGTSNKSGLSSDSCPDSWVWSDEKTSNKSVVFSNKYGAFSDFSDDERSSKKSVTSSTVVSGHFRQYVGLRVPNQSFWRIKKILENCEMGEEMVNVEADGLFDLDLDRKTAFSHVYQALCLEGNSISFKA